MDSDLLHYDLPPERIAQRPAADRSGARLLVARRDSGEISAHGFAHLVDALRPGDLLVLNDTRVEPCRIRGTKPTGGRVEITFVDPEPDGSGPWALVRARKRPEPGQRIALPGDVELEVVRLGEGGRVCFDVVAGDLGSALAAHGRMPLPPYIRRPWEDAVEQDAGTGAPNADAPSPRELDALDRERYQTVVARNEGAVAAPTAGLHFSDELLARLDERGVGFTTVTLHVGYGSFQPVRTERVQDHALRAERFTVGEEASARIAETRAAGGRVVAVGTTVVRTLEATAGDDGVPVPGSGWTDLMILPGHRFRAVDALVTNFHQPMTTLLALVLAFGGVALVREAYARALDEGFRFLSYGDSMLID